MKYFIAIIGLIALIAIPCLIIHHDNLMQSCMGKQIVIQKDTLIIVDYSALKQTFIMHNGKEFGEDFTVNTIEEQQK